MDADIFISLTHFKGHESTGFGGTLKNIGMGCGSRAGKMEQHCDGKPTVDREMCRACRQCIKQCAHGAISYDEKKIASIDHDRCVGCGLCGEVAHAAVLCPSFYRADVVHNPTWWDRALARWRGTVIGWLQRRRAVRVLAA